jgi:hypothetical protein
MLRSLSQATMPSTTTVEISVKGKWTRVPGLFVNGKNIVIRGKWIKKAVVDAEEWLETEVEDPAFCVTKLREQQSPALRADIFVFTQKLPATAPKYTYPIEWHSIAVARVSTFKDWWEKLPQVTRKNVRRSEKRGVVVVVKELDDQLVREIIDVNNDSPFRQNVPFTHFGKTFEEVKRDQSSFRERSDFICAYHGDELIGFVKLVYRGDVASILQILPRASHSDKRPANALIAKAVEVCAQKGVSYLTYGMLSYGNKSESSLIDFKRHNGFEEILVPRYFVPLTAWGAICLKAKLHRGLLGVLPLQAIKTALRARTNWYHLKRKIKPV